MTLRLLLVEDDRELRATLRAALLVEGYEVLTAASLSEGLALLAHAGHATSGMAATIGPTSTGPAMASPARARDQDPAVDAVLLDLGLPDGDGETLLATLRKQHKLPVLVISARQAEGQKVRLLDAGADDYLVKPFEYPELAARVKALLRRALKATSSVLALGPLAVDFAAQSATLDGAAMDLTAFEFRLLEYLVRERARVVSKQELSDYLYPHDEDRDSNVLEVLIGRLRRKLDPGGLLAPIETLRGRGYRFTLG